MRRLSAYREYIFSVAKTLFAQLLTHGEAVGLPDGALLSTNLLEDKIIVIIIIVIRTVTIIIISITATVYIIITITTTIIMPAACSTPPVLPSLMPLCLTGLGGRFLKIMYEI